MKGRDKVKERGPRGSNVILTYSTNKDLTVTQNYKTRETKNAFHHFCFYLIKSLHCLNIKSHRTLKSTSRVSLTLKCLQYNHELRLNKSPFLWFPQSSAPTGDSYSFFTSVRS